VQAPVFQNSMDGRLAPSKIFQKLPRSTPVGSQPLRSDDPFGLDLMISDEAQAQVSLAHIHLTEIVLADEVDVGFHRVDTQGTESLYLSD